MLCILIGVINIHSRSVGPSARRVATEIVSFDGLLALREHQRHKSFYHWVQRGANKSDFAFFFFYFIAWEKMLNYSFFLHKAHKIYIVIYEFVWTAGWHV